MTQKQVNTLTNSCIYLSVMMFGAIVAYLLMGETGRAVRVAIMTISIVFGTSILIKLLYKPEEKCEQPPIVDRKKDDIITIEARYAMPVHEQMRHRNQSCAENYIKTHLNSQMIQHLNASGAVELYTMDERISPKGTITFCQRVRVLRPSKQVNTTP